MPRIIRRRRQRLAPVVSTFRSSLQEPLQGSGGICPFAQRLATEQMQDLSLYNACLLISFDENPVVRPIGVAKSSDP